MSVTGGGGTNVASRRGMTLWSTLTGITRFGIEISRSALGFGERLVPWPLSLVPRALRLPLDVAADVAALVTGSPTAFAPRDEDAAPARTARPPRPDAPRASAAPDARRAGTARRQPPSSAQQPPPYTEPRTATIAGARSDGPDDAQRHDREFRARQAPLYVRDAGHGPAIVLLHAFPLNSRMWEPQLEELSDRFRVIAPDFAGFGLSWVPEGTFSLDEQAHAIDLTLDDLQIDELVLVGLSMGGYVALPLLERLGSRVRGLVLANTRATADDEATVSERHRLATEVEAEGVDVAAEELLPKLLGATAARDRPDLVDRVHGLVLESREAGMAGALRAMAARRDWTSRLARISCPVLVIGGEEDLLVPPATVHAMAARIRNAVVEILPGGHLSNLESSADFDRTLADFAWSAFGAPRAAPRARRAGA